MTGVALKGLMGRKVRAILTAVAIVLGVAMVSGTYVLTDTIKAAFTSVFTQAYKNADAVVTGKSALGSDNGGNGGNEAPSLPASLLTRIQALPQVQAATGGISDNARLVGRNGKVISRGGAPGLGFSYSRANQRFSPLTLASGGWPTQPDQIDIDTATASKQGFKVGETIGVIARGPVRALPGRRHRELRRRVLARRRHPRDLHAPHGPADLRQAGPLRPDQRGQ